MHRSRLAGLVIDCRGEDLEGAASFWSQALGLAVKPSEAQPDPLYVDMETPPDEPGVLVQKVEHESRVHLDIETDDIEAEAQRLEALGARRLGPIKTWVVMEAPTGQRFCLVRPQRADFDAAANRWDE